MRGKRGAKAQPKLPYKKVKRSKKFWQQRKTNTISQVQASSDSETDGENVEGGLFKDEEEPTTEYQKLLEAFVTEKQASNERLVSSDSEIDEEGEDQATSSEGT